MIYWNMPFIYKLNEPLAEFADGGIFCSGDRSLITLGAGQA